ncbi:MAG: hypothetical protein PHV82_19020 [Victivallaceae bacterium]|nr:hypothetical protein [Victivallaceae bacterium]
MLPQPGRYACQAGERGVYESKGGALMLAMVCVIDEQTSITAYQCLVQKDGTLNTRTIENLKEIFSWDGTDPMWLQDADLSNVDFSITVEPAKDDKGNDTVTVAWVNPPGGGPASIQKSDSNSIRARFGAKFRAAAGGRPMTPQSQSAPQKNMSEPCPPAPAAQAGRALILPSFAAKSNINEVWEALSAAAPRGTGTEALTEIWRKGISLTGKSQTELTSEEWGKVRAAFEDYYKEDQIPM